MFIARRFMTARHPLQEATAGRRMAWIREQHRLYARDLALEYQLVPADPEYPHTCRAEAFSAACGFGIQCKATPDEVIAAADAEWTAANKAVSECLQHLRRAVWPLCANKLPKQVIDDAAERVCERYDVFVPTPLLTPLLARTWDAATRRRRQYGRV